MEENLNEQETTEGNFLTQHIKGKYLVLSLVILFILIIILLGTVFLAKTEKVVENRTTQISKITPTESPKISIPCPTIKSFCNTKNEIIKDGKIVGLKGMLLKGTPVYAVLDGSIQARTVGMKTKNGVEKYNKISLISKDNKYIGEYFFKAVKVTKYIVKKGDTIFYINSEDYIFPQEGAYNFAFTLLDKEAKPIDFNQISTL